MSIRVPVARKGACHGMKWFKGGWRWRDTRTLVVVCGESMGGTLLVGVGKVRRGRGLLNIIQ